MNPIVELNGQLLAAESARVPVTDLGVLYGIGLFETMRAYGGRVFRFDRHIERLLASAAELGLPIKRDMLPDEQRIAKLLEANALADARVRLTTTGGAPGDDGIRHSVLTTAVALEPYPPEYYSAGIMVRVSPHWQASTDPLARHKTTCYWSRLQALHAGQAAECGETLWFTERKQLAEGSISNVFVIKEGTVKTPPLDTPVLPGITRAAIIELCCSNRIGCTESPLVIHDLLNADEVFVCNSMMEVVPVRQVEQRPIGEGKVGDLTTRLLEAYRALVKRETAHC